MVGGVPTTDFERTDNVGAVLLDYLTNTAYGPNLSDSNIDMADLQNTFDRSEYALQDGGAAPGAQGGTADCASLRIVASEGQIAALEAAEHLGNEAGITAACRAIRHARGWASRGTTPGATKSYKQALRKVRLGAYNGEVDTSLNFADAVEQIVQATPGLAVASTFGDKLRITMPDWQQTAAAQSVATITDPMMVGTPVQVTDPDAEGQYNKYEVTFNDIDKSFHENSETWQDDDLVAVDNGEIIEREERVAGCCTDIQALTLARNRCLVSRRQVYTGGYNILSLGRSMGKGLAVIEPNDVFRVQSPLTGVDAYCLMQEFTIDWQTQVCQFTAIEFNPLDYGPVLAARPPSSRARKRR